MLMDNPNKIAMLNKLNKFDLVNMILELHLTLDSIHEETDNMLERNGVEYE
jgi:hypothetical protein